MSSVVVEYPEGLPAPTTGSVTITERRKGSTIGGRKNFRTFQRDRHGQRTIAFTFTPMQAAIFREWWAEWLQCGGGWFAAEWPLPWTRGPSVFRFQDPPQWALIGGTPTGQGYWRVTATVEIRGRGMLPEMEVMYLTSTPYPIVYNDSMSYEGVDFAIKFPPVYNHSDEFISGLGFNLAERSTLVNLQVLEMLQFSLGVNITTTIPLVNIKILDALDNNLGVSMSARAALITYTTPADAINVELGVLINVSVP